MAKAFSVASWNVEHFRGRETRVADVVEFLGQDRINPDVFALYEVEGATVFEALTRGMPGYSFHITEGRQAQEILVGVKRTMTGFFTQKVEFKSGNQYLRPGALLTVVIDDVNYCLLFLHTKSLPTPVGFGLRDDMLERAFKFKRVLDKAAGGRGKSNFIFLGDLNTMGLDYPYDQDIPTTLELRRLDGRASRNKMRRLEKTFPFTFWNGPGSSYPMSDLDHVVVSKQVKLRRFADGAELRVLGWPEQNTPAEQGKWIDRYSDHALLYFEVQKP